MNDQFHFQANSFSEPPIGHAKGYAITAVVLGICSMFFCLCCCCFYYVAAPCGVVAIVFAILSRRDNGGRFSGMALAGLILGIIGLLFFGVWVAMEIGLSGVNEEQAFNALNDFYKDKFGIDLEEALREGGYGDMLK